MSPRRILGNVILGVGAVVGTLAALLVGLWAYLTEPWYEGEVIRHLRAGPRDAPWRDETARLRALFPDGMAAASATSLLRASGFSCGQAQADSGEGTRFSCVRKTHAFPCEGSYTVDLTIDPERGLTARSGHSYLVCL